VFVVVVFSLALTLVFDGAPRNPIYFIVNVHIGLLKMMFSKIGADKLFSSLEMQRFSPILSYIILI